MKDGDTTSEDGDEVGTSEGSSCAAGGKEVSKQSNIQGGGCLACAVGGEGMMLEL